MAGDWIKMTHELPDKPEVLAISGKTGINRLEVVGRLFVLWRWFDQHTVDGNASSVTKVTLSECIFGFGADTKFIQGVIEAGWLEEYEGGIRVVNFEAHISESAKQRALTSKRVAKAKAKDGAKGNGKGNAATVTTVTQGALPNALPREDIEGKPPTSPNGDVPPQKSKKKSEACTFADWLVKIKASGEKAISDYKPVFEYAEAVGLPVEWIELAWLKFRQRYTTDQKAKRKRYTDWRQVFLNAVKDNWLKLWWFRDGQAGLTTVGQQAELEHRKAA